MKLNDRELLYMEESFLDSYIPYTHNELQVLYRIFKEYQLSDSLSVELRYDELQSLFLFDELTFYDVISKFIATAPVRPFFLGTYDDRELVYFIKYGILDREKNVVRFELTEDVKRFFKAPQRPAVLNLSVIQKFIGKKDRFCNEIKIYESISYDFNKYADSDCLYVPYTIDELFFRSSVFEWYEEKYRNLYLEGTDIQKMAQTVTEDKEYKSNRHMWCIFSRSFIIKTIELINNLSDVYIDGYTPVKYNHLTTGIIFKVRRNSKVKDISYLDDINGKMGDDELSYQEKCKLIYNTKHS